MSKEQLYDKVLCARLQHALLLENAMTALLRRLTRGEDEGICRKYEWYAQQAKALATKDLIAVGKTMGEVQDEFRGFDDD